MFEAHTDFHQLTIRLKSGDEDAYDYVIRATTRLVIAYLRKRGFSLEDARDIWSDGQLKLWQTLCRDYDPRRSSFPTWLLKVIENLANDQLRKNRKKQLVGLEEAEKLRAPNSTDQKWSGKWDVELAEYAISTLSQDDQDLIALRLQGYTKEEIARILNTSAAAVGMSIFRVVKKLRKKVKRLNTHEQRRKYYRTPPPDSP